MRKRKVILLIRSKMATALHIDNVSKVYHLGEFGKSYGLRDNGISGKKNEELTALANMSFSVQKGEVLGIIGANGAGKSTLLKLLSQITRPSSGVIRAKGKISSLLEVGTGMHPELTGRENIFLNGAILGMQKSEITDKFDEIVAFSECSDFIDTPIKRYSSGMKVRLGFSVAAFLDPEIIIIDEVLAVGDAQFQTKAIRKILDISADKSKTILIVSHNMASIKSLCSRCVVLKKGELIFDGDVDLAISNYLGYDTQETSRRRVWAENTAPGNARYKLRKAIIRAEGKDDNQPLTTDDRLTIEVELDKAESQSRVDMTFQLLSESGEFLAAWSTIDLEDVEGPESESSFSLSFSSEIPANIFNQRTYRLNLLILENQKAVVCRFDDLFKLSFATASRHPESWMGQSTSYFLPHFKWNINLPNKSS